MSEHPRLHVMTIRHIRDHQRLAPTLLEGTSHVVQETRGQEYEKLPKEHKWPTNEWWEIPTNIQKNTNQ